MRIDIVKRVLCPICGTMPKAIIGRRYFCLRCGGLFEFEECSCKTITRKARRRNDEPNK